MRGVFALAAAAATSLVTALPVETRAKQIFTNMEVTKWNTVNGTRASPAQKQRVEAQGTPLTFALVNNLATTNQMYAYISGKDANGAPVLMTTGGSWYYPDPAGSLQPVLIPSDSGIALPIGTGANSTTEITIPDFIESGRVYVSEGELTFSTVAGSDGTITTVDPSFTSDVDPSKDINWGFVELTNNSNGIYANISFVDFVGLIMSMRLTLTDGSTQQVEGLASETAVEDLCNGMEEQAASDGQAWDKMCIRSTVDDTPLRVLAPNMYVTLNPGSFDEYWSTYIDDVWAKYTNEDLTIESGGDLGTHVCRVTNDALACEGDDQPLTKPAAADIFGCSSGPFANEGTDLHKNIVARVCAAFHRSTLLLDGGNVQPALSADNYYTTDPTTHYSRIIHELETDQLGYAFSYDDVNPEGENAAGVVQGMPQRLEIFIGGQIF